MAGKRSVAAGRRTASRLRCNRPRIGLPPLPASRPAAPPRQAVVRHALRLGVTLFVVAAAAHWIGHDTDFAAHSSWMLLGTWIAMQPDRQATTQAALRRGLGTAIGGLVTLVLVGITPSTLWVGWIFFVLAFVAFGLRTVNYAWYCVAMTPIVVVGFAGAELNREVLAARVVDARRCRRRARCPPRPVARRRTGRRDRRARRDLTGSAAPILSGRRAGSRG
ncbi:MAG: FUSC family protein [Ilumatobacteraceae bacterium]